MVGPNVRPDIKIYKEAIQFLRSTVHSEEEVIAHFKAAVLERSPLAMDFAPAGDLEKRREAWAAEDAKAGAIVNGNGNGKKA